MGSATLVTWLTPWGLSPRRLTCGKHEGELLSEVPTGYLRWLDQNIPMQQEEADAILRELSTRKPATASATATRPNFATAPNPATPRMPQPPLPDPSNPWSLASFLAAQPALAADVQELLTVGRDTLFEMMPTEVARVDRAFWLVWSAALPMPSLEVSK